MGTRLLPRLMAEDLDPIKTPPLAAEVILGEFGNIAKPHIDRLLDFTPGVVRGGELIADISLYVAAQYVRGQTFRDEQLSLIDWSDRQDQTELTTRLARSLLTCQGRRCATCQSGCRTGRGGDAGSLTNQRQPESTVDRVDVVDVVEPR